MGKSDIGLFIERMFEGVLGTDTIIFVIGILTVIPFGLLLRANRSVEKWFSLSAQERKIEELMRSCNGVNKWSAVFSTLITIFPLLGMLGTVMALVTLDISGQTEEVKNNFFAALTSTGWGIIFSIIYKVVNAFAFYKQDINMEKAERIIELRNNPAGGRKPL